MRMKCVSAEPLVHKVIYRTLVEMNQVERQDVLHYPVSFLGPLRIKDPCSAIISKNNVRLFKQSQQVELGGTQTGDMGSLSREEMRSQQRGHYDFLSMNGEPPSRTNAKGRQMKNISHFGERFPNASCQIINIHLNVPATVDWNIEFM
jgi:hypothetical protein